MNIKRYVSVLVVAASCAWFVTAEEAEKVTLSIGALKVVDLPFVMQNYRMSSQDIIKLENFSEKQLRIIGQKQGSCELEVMGGGLTKQYSVSVVDNIRQIYERLKVDLDTLPELDISINQDYIVIKGEVSSIKNWEHLNKVLPMYQGSCRNYASFRPAPELILNFKKLLEQSGYVLSEKPIPTEPGLIGFQFAQSVITITGSVYHPSDIATIKNLLSTQNWLGQDGAPAGDGKVRVVLNLKVEPTMIDVGTVYVGITKSEGQKLGDQNKGSGIFGALNASAFYDMVAGRGDGNAMINGGLNSLIQFLANNGITRFKTAGHLTFISNDENKKDATFNNGGTMYVKVSGQTSGDLKEVPYGLRMKMSGGMIGGNKVKLNVNIERSDPPLANAQGDYAQKKSDVSTSIICEMNKTVVIGGLKEITESTGNEGFPILRKTPVLQWFVSGDESSKSDMQLLILVSPRVATNDTQIKVPPSAETADTLEQGEKSNAAIEKEDNKKKSFWNRIF